jgi:hypothetical protein
VPVTLGLCNALTIACVWCKPLEHVGRACTCGHCGVLSYSLQCPKMHCSMASFAKNMRICWKTQIC